jgi:hypothetical protein
MLGAQRSGERLVVHRADGLRRRSERGILGVDDGLGQDRHDWVRPPIQRQLGRQRLSQQVPDLALRFGDEHVERWWRHEVPRGVGLDRQVADLGTIAVGQHELVTRGDQLAERSGSHKEVLSLDRRRPLLATVNEGVATEGDDDAAHSSCAPAKSPVRTAWSSAVSVCNRFAAWGQTLDAGRSAGRPGGS